MRKDRGFSLVEIICVLVILGFLGSFASVGFVRMIRLYSSVRDVDAGIQQAQIAMNRLFTEVTTIDKTATAKTFTLDDPSAGSYSVPYKFTSLDGSVGVDNTVSYDSIAKLLSLNGSPLCDNVTSFQMKKDTVGVGVASLKFVTVTLSITVGTKTQALSSQFTLK
jgi:prepilin-type N-terminal cleavage/methylation domain-containing protein